MAWIPLRDGEKLHVISVGRGSPVVLLHGFGSRGMHWLPNILPLAHRYRFYLPDLRGFGNSHNTDLNNRDVFQTYADDVQDLLDHFQLDRVILGGLSTGAFACLNYHAVHGFSRVRSYLNIEHVGDSLHSEYGSTGLFGKRQPEIFARFRETLNVIEQAGEETPYWDLPEEVRTYLRDQMVYIFRQAFNRRWNRFAVSAGGQFGERLLTQILMPIDRWSTYVQILRAFMAGRNIWPSLPHITVPTTLMTGRHSRYFDLEGHEAMLELIPRAQLVIFEHSGHVPMADEPLRFQQEFTRFLLESEDEP
ncbi:alpha/beta fold hydrolase [Marinobacter zhejiangensis]|uniref:Pimeloyl-ACP methyl ester carboxylesterase n=1 Tax=Marinobacter zhejiangensis TaxID=488535 RepID=A0A1I4Q0K6_9GAMM|nr:alpha/beta hydrolase [Marinobacter zhejiangensis]SFM33587.1 Pimeloyl-ACP methyl ester carboxylesterase [Marinobacter zhejiangensis]